MMQNHNSESILILGRAIFLSPLVNAMNKNLTIGERISYDYYLGSYQGLQLAFAEPKGNVPSPRTLAITAKNVSRKIGMSIVYILPNCPAYLRQRLIDKGVNFVVSNKFAFLPNLVANERIPFKKPVTRLSSVAQYILLYHLQVRSLNGFSAKNLKDLIPYSSPSISLGLSCLEDLGLILRERNNKSKVIEFTAKGKELFEKARPYMINPVAERIFCEELTSNECLPVCGVNALAHFTTLNPDSERMIAMSKQSLSALRSADALKGENNFDGNIMIEVWKYQPVTLNGYGSEWVDKISLALSLMDDKDPRVENEVQRLINEMRWSD